MYLELIHLIRTLAQVDDFLENTKVSLSNRDCEAPVPVKIFIGVELDVSVYNDTNHGGRRAEKDPWQICRGH